jgi:hypothetical protein
MNDADGIPDPPHVFPPALVPALRERVPNHQCLRVPEEILNQLVTTTYFAGLDTYEAERQQVRVLFVGTTPLDVLLPDEDAAIATPVYRWKALPFVDPRPFSARELVKLAVAAADDRLYTMVRLVDHRLLITGLAREGINFDGDPFLELVVTHPGALSIHSGRDRIVAYEHGSIRGGAADTLLFETGAVRNALEEIARSAGLEHGAMPEYIHVVLAIVSEMSSHGHGGLLVVSPENHPDLPDDGAFRMATSSALVTLIRLARLLEHRARDGDASSASDGEAPHRRIAAERSSSRQLLRNAMLGETERVIRAIGALSAIDGATVMNRSLALVAFGVTLTVSGRVRARVAADVDGVDLRPFNSGSCGTRHRAGISYAWHHPGSVVVVASQDGPVSSMLRSPSRDEVVVWLLDRMRARAA